MYSGEVTSAKDLQAMSAEVEHLRSRASGMEDSVLALLEEKEPFDAQASNLRATLVDLAATRADATARLAAAEEVLDQTLEKLQAERSAAVDGIPEELLSTYDKLRGRLGGVGVARLVGNHCDGCHLTLSAVELDHIRHLPEGELFTCEQCSRILVP
jgi:predicted  nucleic acid-binding Zn-ribbon protein